MADDSTLAELLDRAMNVFGMASTLSWELKKDNERQGGVNLAGVQPPAWQRHEKMIKEFISTVLVVRDIVENPLDGCADTVEQLRQAGRYAKLLDSHVRKRAYDWDILDLWPYLYQIGFDGYQAVKAARKAIRLVDPFAVFEKRPVSETESAIDATDIIPTWDEIQEKVQSTRDRIRHPNASHNPVRLAADAHNDYATIWRLCEKCGIKAPPLPDHRLHPLQTMNYVLLSLDDVELAVNRRGAQIAESTQNSVADKPNNDVSTLLDSVPSQAFTTAPSEAIAEVTEPAHRPGGHSASATETPKKAKRSTERGEGRAKLIAALTKHHQYSDGSCLNLESIGNNQLARLADVSDSTASDFFRSVFKGHSKYRRVCADVSKLITALKLLNSEFSPYHLYGATPPGEVEPEDE